LVHIFLRLVVAVNDFVTILRVTFSTPVPVAAMVLKYSLRCVVVPVDRHALNPTLATMPAHCVVDVDFPPLGFSLKPQKRFFGSVVLWIESFLKSCLRGFDPFTRAIDYRFSFTAGLEMLLEIACLCESLTAMPTFMYFCQLCDVFYDEGVPFVNSDCQDVCQLGRRASSVMSYHFSIFSALRLINSDSEPRRENGALI